MTIADIPPFVPASPDDLIRSQDTNHAQRLARHAVRSHRHTRVVGTPVDDTLPQDLAGQITTQEIADLAVTAAKLGPAAVSTLIIEDGALASPARLTDGAVTTTKLQDGGVTSARVAANAIARTKLQDGAISRPKLALIEIASGTQFLGGSGTIGVPTFAFIQLFAGLGNTLNTIFIPVLTLAGASGPTTQSAHVEAVMAYRRAEGFSGSGPVVVDLFLHLINSGVSNCTVNWRVMTFGPFTPVYGLGAGIGGGLL